MRLAAVGGIAAGVVAGAAQAVQGSVIVGPGPGGDVPSVGPGAWEAWGPWAPEPLSGGGVRLRGNTSIASAPFAVPEDAQALRLRVAAPGLGALVRVLALPVDGGRQVDLGTRVPSGRPGTVAVSLAPVAGRTVRLVVDPVAAFGAALDVHRVGPAIAPLPGWTVSAGAADVVGAARRVLRVEGETFRAGSAPERHGAGAVALLVAVRGDGIVRADAGGRRAALRAGDRWRDLRVPIPDARRRVSLSLTVIAGDGAVRLRDVGLVVRRVGVASVRSRMADGRVVVTATTRPRIARAAYVVRDARGRVVARGRTAADGRLRASVPAGTRGLRVAPAPGRTVIPVSAAVPPAG